MAYARRRCDDALAEDVVAETFLVAWRRLDDVPAHAALPWLYGIARRTLANQHRGRERLRRSPGHKKVGGVVMPEDDELERLRRADPVAEVSLPSAESPRARALFEEITMTDPTTTELRGAVAPARRRWIAGIAAALLLIGGGAAATALRNDDPSRPDPQDLATDPTTEPITPGGPPRSCVEFYDLSTLADREVAFDGTVKRAEGDTVTFTVNRAYRGVEAGERNQLPFVLQCHGSLGRL